MNRISFQIKFQNQNLKKIMKLNSSTLADMI